MTKPSYVIGDDGKISNDNYSPASLGQCDGDANGDFYEIVCGLIKR
jgi:hypothetical protein